MFSSHPISILVAKSLQKSLQTPAALLSKDEKIEDEEMKKLKTLIIMIMICLKRFRPWKMISSDPEDEIYQDGEKKRERDQNCQNFY